MKKIVLAALVLSVAFIPRAFAEPSSGFYWRGDLGGAIGAQATFRDREPGAANCSLCAREIKGGTGTSVLFGAGIGYRFSRAFRVDFTLDDMPTLKESATVVGGTSTASADINSLVGLANGYLDFSGIWPRLFRPFEPYFTAGVGFARNDIGNFSGSAFNGTLGGHVETTLAWDLGGGIALPFSDRMTLDLGYRYLDLNTLQTGTALTSGGTTTTVTADHAILHVHSVMMSVRYAF